MEENHFEKYYKFGKREKKRKDKNLDLKGGTKAGQAQRIKVSRFYQGSRVKPRIVIIDKTKK